MGAREPLHRQLEKALNQDADSFESNVSWIPQVDVREEAERFVVPADLPGVEGKDIEITAEKGVLTIRGERRSEKKTGRRLQPRRARERHVPASLHAARDRRCRGHQGDPRERRARAVHPQAPAGAAAAHQRPGRLRSIVGSGFSRQRPTALPALPVSSARRLRAPG